MDKSGFKNIYTCIWKKIWIFMNSSTLIRWSTWWTWGFLAIAKILPTRCETQTTFVALILTWSLGGSFYPHEFQVILRTFNRTWNYYNFALRNMMVSNIFWPKTIEMHHTIDETQTTSNLIVTCLDFYIDISIVDILNICPLKSCISLCI